MMPGISGARALAAFAFAFAILVATSTTAAAQTRQFWQDTPNRQVPSGLPAPDAYRSLDLDFQGLRDTVAIGMTVSLPAPDGTFKDFVLSDSGTLPPELAARYPRIRSYLGTDSSGHHARIDISPLGFNAMVFDHESIWIVRPVEYGQDRDYVSFSREDAAAGRDLFHCSSHSDFEAGLNSPASINTTTGVVRRNYRAAVAANHNYVIAISGASTPTVELGLAAVTTAMNRVNEVYENDLAIHMTLVPNNDLIIYPDAAGDPYSNGTGAINQNTPNLNAVIGNGNYDIGHVFTTGSGGVAGLGVVCNTSSKGRGTTGLSNPASLTSDIFYIDYVAHEMGHQFGGNHTFNNSCGGNRAASAAYEPGSASTIMGYAGICSPNLQSNSDPYFHAKSLQEITSLTNGSANCSTNVPNNLAPTVAALTGSTIPASTPFVLEGSASSAAPGANLTYGWEQYDLGAATVNIDVDPGNGPIIRSLIPTTSPIRTIPKFSNLLSGTSMVGEILPTTNRTLTFRLTVFDNVSGGGTSESRDVALQVNAASGPFAVTAPAGGITWDGSVPGTQTVTWNVAGTNAAPVSCASVDIDVYTGGGFESSAALLADNVPNTGSAVVDVPNLQTTSARVRVRCSDNVFFAMSPGDFTIIASDQIFDDGFDTGAIPLDPPTVSKAFAPASVLPAESSTLTITLGNSNAIASTLSATLTDTFPAGLVIAASPNASTTCPGGTVGATAGNGSATLAAGAQIPALGSCTISVNVEAANAGTYSNVIGVGALQTDSGANTGPAAADLTVASNIITSGPINHILAATAAGTSINWISGDIVNDDPDTGYDMNIWGASGLNIWWNDAPSINAGIAPTTGSPDLSILASGASIGPASTFSRTNGAMAAWRAGATGYIGFRFDCSSVGISPDDTCYGYLHLSSTAATGHPATILDYAYDRTGAAITIP